MSAQGGVVRELQPGDPQAIGPYRLVGQLGQGGMGRVYLAVSPGGRPVAVKAIRAELAADPQFRTRFGREVAAARRVSGVFTAQVVDADVDGPVAWMATAYVPGPSLAEAVESHGPLPEASLLALAAGLAESLSAIHAAGVVHRDLKPSNVLLAEDGPRVIDFGISRAAAEVTALTQTGLVIGSPGFMSPEQAMGNEVGPPSDIFNLGAVLVFAATGEGPFGTGTTAALLYRVAHGTPNLDRVPPAVRPLIEHCLAKDPGQRPTAGGLLAGVGALQPGGDWLPDSFTRTFVRAAPSGSALAPSGPAAARSGPALTAPGAAPYSGRATQTTAAGSAAQATRHSRPRRRLWRPMMLAWVIGVLLVVSGATAVALTSFTGKSPSAPVIDQPTAQTSSPADSTSPGQTSPGVSASPSASQRVSYPASAPSFTGTYQSPTATASPSVRTSTSPAATASPSIRTSPSPSASASASASASTSPSGASSSSPPASASASKSP
jgi:serine/threonine protein kinase